MSRLRQKRPRLRLDRAAYRKLREGVLARDGWRCQLCGSLAGVEVHHIEPRSRMGDDCEDNLITLCAACHSRVHRHRLKHSSNGRCFGQPVKVKKQPEG